MAQIKNGINNILTDLSPVVELLQQIFVEVRGANGSDPLAPDQSLQLLPRWLKVRQTLAVTLRRPGWCYDDRVKLGHGERLAGYGM